MQSGNRGAAVWFGHQVARRHTDNRVYPRRSRGGVLELLDGHDSRHLYRRRGCAIDELGQRRKIRSTMVDAPKSGKMAANIGVYPRSRLVGIAGGCGTSGAGVLTSGRVNKG